MKSRKERTNSESASTTRDCVKDIQDVKLLHKVHTKSIIQDRIDFMIKTSGLKDISLMVLTQALNRRAYSKMNLQKADEEQSVVGSFGDYIISQKHELSEYTKQHRKIESEATKNIIPNTCRKWDKDVRFITKLIGRAEDEEQSKENEDEL